MLALFQGHLIVAAAEVDRQMPGHRTQLPGHIVTVPGQGAGADEGFDGFRRAALSVITGAAQGQFQGHFQARAGLGRRFEQGQRLAHIPAVLLEQRQFLPQGRRGRRQTDRQGVRPRYGQAPIERRTDVFQATGIALDPQAGRNVLPVVLRLMHQGQAAFGMAFAGGGQLAGLFEFFQGIAARGVEQAVEHLFVTDVHVQQGFGHQLRDRAKYLARFHLFADDHRRRRRQGKAATEQPESAQASLFADTEQIEAPVQGGAQGLMPTQG